MDTYEINEVYVITNVTTNKLIMNCFKGFHINYHKFGSKLSIIKCVHACNLADLITSGGTENNPMQ